MIMGSSFSDFVFNNLWQNPAHRSRIRTLSRNSVPSSSLINCSLLASVPSNPTVSKPLWSLFARSRSVPARLRSTLEVLRQSPSAGSHAKISQCLPRGSIPGVGTKELSCILPRCPCWNVCGQGFGRLTPSSMSAVATCRGWYLFFERINDSRSEKLSHARRIRGLDRLVEGRNDPGDYSFTALSVGHKKLPVELSAFCRSRHLFVCWAQSDHRVSTYFIQ